MFKLISIFPALLLVALALLVAGCGGGDDDGTVTKAEFIKQADAICYKTDFDQYPEVTAYAKKNAASLNRLSFAKREEKLTADIFAPSIRREIKGLEALEIPAGEKAKVQKLFTAFNKALADYEKDPASYQRGGIEDPFNEAQELARSYGFVRCRELI